MIGVRRSWTCTRRAAAGSIAGNAARNVRRCIGWSRRAAIRTLTPLLPDTKATDKAATVGGCHARMAHGIAARVYSDSGHHPILLVRGARTKEELAHGVVKGQNDRLDISVMDAKERPDADVIQLAPGSQLGPYQILSLLGAGGMGQVYKAFDPRLHREIAIKIAAERFSERFDREVRAIATLNHPNVCTIHDVGPNYLVTELVDGETLRDWFRRALPIERNLEIARQVLEALRAAHHADIVHRDLKPENVMVRSDGYVKVLDFGLAARMPTPRFLQAESVATTDSTLIAPKTEDDDNRRLSLPGARGHYCSSDIGHPQLFRRDRPRPRVPRFGDAPPLTGKRPEAWSPLARLDTPLRCDDAEEHFFRAA
jgi:predicted Ser/Thr protein kinase